MEKIVYSIKDERVGFNAPFLCENEAEAERSFATLVMDDNSMIGKFPEDYSLYEIGTMDMESGVLVTAIPELIIRAREVKKGEF